jgi:hypothetical protein
VLAAVTLPNELGVVGMVIIDTWLGEWEDHVRLLRQLSSCQCQCLWTRLS